MKNPPLIFEIVGLAGTGKTTILQALKKCNKEIKTNFTFKRIRYIPSSAGIFPLLFQSFIYRYKKSRCLTWEEIKVMVYLDTLYNALARKTSGNGTVIVLDQGPVYILTWLHNFVVGSIKDEGVRRWWNNMLNKWASVLDTVIWLVAPDEVLVERINVRDQWHIVKGKTEQDVCEFLARFHMSYEHVISRLTSANTRLRVFNIDTHKEAPNQVVDKIYNLVA